MKRWVVVLLVLIAFGLGSGAGVLGLLWSTGGISEASRDTSEMVATLSLNAEPTLVPDALVTQIAGLDAKVDSVAAQIDSLSTVVAANPGASAQVDSEADSATPEATAEAAAEVTGPSRALFRINEDESLANFYIEEVLLGNPTTVVGTTRRVAGDLIVNFETPAQSQVGEIAVNVRTLKTDQDFRDQSIRGQILETSVDGNEFATFMPTRLIGLPDSPIAVGETVEFQIEGDLTLKGNTQTAIFDATVTLASAEQITGTAQTEIVYADYGITINTPPQVGGVGDTVILEIEFTADLIEAA